jgi:hypothetical protein
MLCPPLPYFDHLVSQVKITILAPSLVIDLGSGQKIRYTLDVYIKASFCAKIYMFAYFVYYRYLESEKVKLLSDQK